MTTSIEEAKAFLLSAQGSKSYKNWLAVSKRSWSELKNRGENDQLFSLTTVNTRKKYRYPAWWSIFKIRQPIILSRIGDPVGKDTSNDGNDPLGACAALAIERLAINLPKTFDFFDVLCACRDDFLATNFALLRGYYERETVKEKVKEYITFTPDNQGGGMFLDSKGKPVDSDEIFQDEAGNYYIETKKIIDVEDERICLESILYKDVFIDPVRHWGRAKRLAMREYFSPVQFKQVFGLSAYKELVGSAEYKKAVGDDADKAESIAVIEYWDLYDKEVIWFPEHGSNLIEPVIYKEANDGESDYGDISELNGLFNLEKFFPVPKPLMINAPTDEFWPIPEYIQLKDWFEDIHSIFSKMVLATRSIRNRLIYDGSIPGLKVALSELSESDTIGVNNLTQALQASGGTLKAVAQYIPVEEIINSLAQYYTALDQRLNSVYRLTSTSDFLQGQSIDNTGKTLGERQMEEKYVSSAFYEPQRKMAEFVRDSYQLMCEMALKNFKDESLDRYIIPQTFPKELAQYYPQALQLLKSDLKRFRVELETDSTIALNENYDKQMRLELFNAMTKGLESVANVAETQPELASADLHALKFLLQGFRQGKLFQEEVTQAIDAVIKKMSEPKDPAPDYQAETLKLEQAKLKAQYQTDQSKLMLEQSLGMAKINQDGQIAMLKDRLEQFKVQLEQGKDMATLQLEYQKLEASISEAQAKIVNDREALMVELRKIVGDQEAERFRLILEQQSAPAEQALEAQRQQIDVMELQLRAADQAANAQERQSIDTHTTTDNVLQDKRLQIDAAKLALEAKKIGVEAKKAPPITVNIEQPKTTKKTVKLGKDSLVMKDEQSA